jgi:hypothetical protein
MGIGMADIKRLKENGISTIKVLSLALMISRASK